MSSRWTAERAEQQRQWRKANRERVRSLSLENYYRHREKRLIANRTWKTKNKEKVLSSQRAWSARNRDRVRAYMRSRRSEKAQIGLAHRLRNRVLKLIRQCHGEKSAVFVELLGIDLLGFRRHIEQLFLPGMTWENRRSWHIDHIRPCASFDLTDAAEQKKCFHYTNHQPLWAKLNLEKGARWKPTT